jgi:hypothetical protein
VSRKKKKKTSSSLTERTKQVWSTAYLPISTTDLFDRYGLVFNTSFILTTSLNHLNETSYASYSPLYLPVTYATTIGLSFTLATAALVHTAIYHGTEIIARIKRVKIEEDDVHAKLMKNYAEVPDWWYFLFIACSLGLSIVAVAVSASSLPACDGS